MKFKNFKELSVSFVACALLAACGSDDPDEMPTVTVASSVALKENRSVDIISVGKDDGSSLSYQWTQESGPTLTLANITSAIVGVTAPNVDADGTAVLRVTVTDSANQTASATVSVLVANNQLPTVTAAFEGAVEKSAVTLTASATDPDGSISSYLWTQTSGAPVILTGETTASLSFTAPSVSADTDLGFSLMVTDDDDESASVVGTVTVTPVMVTYTVTGNVADAAFAGSEVSGTLAGTSFSTTTDSNGAFTLPLKADDDETNLFTNLMVKSSGTAGLEYYKFVPQLTADPVQAAVAGKVSSRTQVSPPAAKADTLADEGANAVSINAVSTALYSLIVSANNGEVPADLDQFTFVEKSVSPDELIEAAAVVKLLTQGGAFALPEGVSNVLELLTNTEAYNSYVTAAENATPGIISATVNDIIADPELTPPVSADSLAKTYYEVFPAAPGFLSRGGGRFDFNSDGSGAETFSRGVHQFTWTLTDGTLTLTYADTMGSFYYPAVAVGVAGLTQAQVDQLNAAGVNQVEVQSKPQSTTMKRVIEGEKTDTFRIVTTVKETMTPVVLTGGTTITTDGKLEQQTSDQLMRNGDKLVDFKLTADDVVSDWILEHYYYFGDPDYGYSDMFADLFEVSADGTGVARVLEQSFTWVIDDKGTFVATFEDGSSVHITKLDQSGSDIQVFSESYDAEGNLLAADTDYALELENGVIGTFDLTNSEGKYWNTTINQWRKSAWDNGNLLWDDGFAYFGWQFNANGEGYQLGSFQSSPPDFAPLFNTPINWMVDTESDDVAFQSIYRWKCGDVTTEACARRDWYVLKELEFGVVGPRIYVFEFEERRIDSQSPWYVARGLGPRLNIYEEIAFDYWNQTAVPAAFSRGMQASRPYGAGGTGVARLVLEPSQTPAVGF
ncbi:PKD domain-containing protein [Shewanella amazonensis]|uniref:Chitinase n=1 Tax=Shewanella amazonensis (strain ATCC BAA-1098 / SB2B) TaxID=326297 RepID=A1S4T1_SHEAM|nr:hypothetical protein [Shewanella amazonensis]ABL99387.1 hypothetical protein Sama_1180 [Shewanella amazonensis SB2B]